jgi:nucleotide-binding universal stress UspA family protein
MTKHTALIPLDGSSFSDQIVPHIRRLLDPEDYSLVLLRVAEPIAGLVGAPPRPVSIAWTAAMHELARDLEYASHPIYATQAEASERAALERELLDAQRQFAQVGYDVSLAVRFGDAAEEIVAFAKQEAVDLVAMATHGRTGLLHLILGSVAAEVLRSLTIPILLVRPSVGEAEKP